MTTRLNPYLNFRDNARAAMTFYRSVFGGELTLSTFQEAGMPVEPADQDLIMHSQLETPILQLMGADVPSHMEWTPNANGSISLSGGPEDETELRGFWDGLSDGATITVPLDKAPWGDTFGMLVDKFGVNWLVNIAGSTA